MPTPMITDLLHASSLAVDNRDTPFDVYERCTSLVSATIHELTQCAHVYQLQHAGSACVPFQCMLECPDTKSLVVHHVLLCCCYCSQQVQLFCECVETVMAKVGSFLVLASMHAYSLNSLLNVGCLRIRFSCSVPSIG
jgi:hypothetical protein